jgi:hypothetical protein
VKSSDASLTWYLFLNDFDNYMIDDLKYKLTTMQLLFAEKMHES